MKITVNGRPVEFPGVTAGDLAAFVGISAENAVVIAQGYQCPLDAALKEGDEITLLSKGEMPPREELERMLCARHTPGVYQKVRSARVGIAGLGGLGSAIALALARTGVGTLHLVDFDTVEPSNLNRQQYRICHLGKAKTQALQEEIAEVNPTVRVVCDRVRVTSDNAARLFRDDPIVCEAFDRPEDKAMLVNTLLEQCPDTVMVAASGMAGTGSANAIRTRRAGRRLYLCGDETSASQPGMGLMAPRVMVCAGHQANGILRLILGEADESI